MIDVLIFFIGASLLLYVVLGGSDYGAGILELLPAGDLRDRQKQVINHAMGPVWEANHIWLILVVVILFTGFPSIFTTLMNVLHLPMLALLVGVVVRGTAFTFRHYDPVQTGRSQQVYTALFGLSSFWSALWLGIIVASLNRGLIDPRATDVWSAYIAPWWGVYPLAVGGFVVCIFVFLASVYLVGETEDAVLKKHFLRRAVAANIAVVVSGGLVFATSFLEQESLPQVFFRSPITIGVMVLASAFFVILWLSVARNRAIVTRVIAAGQVTLILLGWWLLYAPNALLTREKPLSFYEAAAPEATLVQLVIALLIGSLFIFPSLVMLLRVFKRRADKDGLAKDTTLADR